jgi:hypothetical protein
MISGGNENRNMSDRLVPRQIPAGGIAGRLSGRLFEIADQVRRLDPPGRRARRSGCGSLILLALYRRLGGLSWLHTLVATLDGRSQRSVCHGRTAQFYAFWRKGY